MNESIIAVRYARALLNIGQENNTLEKLEEDILLVSGAVKGSEELMLLLGNPVVRASQKSQAMHLIFGTLISDVSIRFIDLLIKNRREALLPDVARSFLRKAKEHRGIRTAALTTAVPISRDMAETIKKVVEQMYRSSIELDVRQDPSILGGYVLRIDDDRYDASVASGLKRIKHVLTQRKI